MKIKNEDEKNVLFLWSYEPQIQYTKTSDRSDQTIEKLCWSIKTVSSIFN